MGLGRPNAAYPTLSEANDEARCPPSNSIDMYEKLKENGIPCKLNLYNKGGHGLGLAYYTEAEGWAADMVSFLKEYLD